MDLENEKVLKLIFPAGVPDNLRDDPELFRYLNVLGTSKLDQLKKEQSRLAEETKNIVEQTQDLAISNYKTFIQTAENSRTIFKVFQKAEKQGESSIEKLPELSGKCEKFLSESTGINEERRLNSITLHKNAQLLEILEMPQLMESCIREGRYEEALELASCVQKMGQNQGHIAVINSIVKSVESLWHTMLVQLVAQLRTDLQLPKCLQIVGYLRRMQAFSNSELRLKFLQARDVWLNASLKDIPKEDAQQHLTKTIDVTRINLFNIITQYRAIFPEEEPNLPLNIITLKPLESVSCNGDRLFQAWLHSKIEQFLKTLQQDLQRGVNSLDTVLGQCMYFGLSFSRVGADFRALMSPIFVSCIRSNISSILAQVNDNFTKELEKYTLINRVALHRQASSEMPGNSESLAPPDTLLDFHPLASLCNGYLNALNQLRLCAPLAVAGHLTQCLQQSLELAARCILTFYRQEQQAFTSSERETFVKLCSCFAYDLLPYVQQCIHAIYPQQTLMAQLGLNLMALEKAGITHLQKEAILEPLKHLLPKNLDLLGNAKLTAELNTEDKKGKNLEASSAISAEA